MVLGTTASFSFLLGPSPSVYILFHPFTRFICPIIPLRRLIDSKNLLDKYFWSWLAVNKSACEYEKRLYFWAPLFFYKTTQGFPLKALRRTGSPSADFAAGRGGLSRPLSASVPGTSLASALSPSSRLSCYGSPQQQTKRSESLMKPDHITGINRSCHLTWVRKTMP